MARKKDDVVEVTEVVKLKLIYSAEKDETLEVTETQWEENKDRFELAGFYEI